MSTRFKILRRLGGAPGAPSLPTGELAFNDSGNSAGDKDSLYVGSIVDGTASLLVSKDRQVEITGEQLNIQGRKVFKALGFGDAAGINEVNFPVGRGTSGQILKLSSAADTLEWAAQSSVNTQTWDVSGTGDAWTDICAMDFSGQNGLVASFITMGVSDLHIFTHNGVSFLWVGPHDATEVGSGGSYVCTSADVSSIGNAVSFASDGEVKQGTITNKATSPKTIGDNYLRKTEDAGGTDVPQVMDNSTRFDRDLFVGDGISPASIYMGQNGILGDNDTDRFRIGFSEMLATAAMKLTGAVAGVIQGDGATTNQIDNMIFDAGTF